jgi:hypothetical protein
MILSRRLLRRALLVVHGLATEATERGWDIAPYSGPGYGRLPGIAIEIRGQRYPVEVHELTETVPFTEGEIAAWRAARRSPWKEDRAAEIPPPQFKLVRRSRRLGLFLPHGFRGGRVRWNDGPRGLVEQKLGSVLRALEQRAAADELADIEHAERRERLRREQDVREERARRRRIDDARIERLLSEVAAWRRASGVRDYAAALEDRLPDLDGAERARIQEWIAWARGWSDEIDPACRTSLIVGIDDERDAH